MWDQTAGLLARSQSLQPAEKYSIEIICQLSRCKVRGSYILPSVLQYNVQFKFRGLNLFSRSEEIPVLSSSSYFERFDSHVSGSLEPGFSGRNFPNSLSKQAALFTLLSFSDELKHV